MNFKNLKREKGLTLIALAVTIVVLLILAGVSINAVFSQNGIIKKAQHAQNTMEQAQQNDLKELEKLEEILDQYTRPETQKDVTDAGYMNSYANAIGDLNDDGRITADDVKVVQYIISGETFPELNDYMTQENNENVITLIDENGNLLNNTLFRYIVYDINRDGKINETDINFIKKAIDLGFI